MSLEKLRSLQKTYGAYVQEGRVSHYGDAIQEIALLGQVPLLFDASDLGTLRIQGEDRLSFLNRLITADLNQLPTGTWKKGLWVNGKGRFEHRFHIYLRSEDILLVLKQEEIKGLFKKLEMYHFAEKVSFASAPWRVFYLHGPGSRQVLETIFHQAPMEPDRFIQVNEILLASSPQYQQSEGFEILVPEVALSETFEQLLQTSAKPAGDEARKHFRVQYVEPEVGHELTSELIPLEVVSLKSWISFEKGCFPGQEVLARMNNLGHPGKILAKFSIPQGVVPEKATLYADPGGEAGIITSVSPHPPFLALGFLKWKFREHPSSFFIETSQGKIHLERIL